MIRNISNSKKIMAVIIGVILLLGLLTIGVAMSTGVISTPIHMHLLDGVTLRQYPGWWY